MVLAVLLPRSGFAFSSYRFTSTPFTGAQLRRKRHQNRLLRHSDDLQNILLVELSRWVLSSILRFGCTFKSDFNEEFEVLGKLTIHDSLIQFHSPFLFLFKPSPEIFIPLLCSPPCYYFCSSCSSYSSYSIPTRSPRVFRGQHGRLVHALPLPHSSGQQSLGLRQR